jgi:hypothetical protein
MAETYMRQLFVAERELVAAAEKLGAQLDIVLPAVPPVELPVGTVPERVDDLFGATRALLDQVRVLQANVLEDLVPGRWSVCSRCELGGRATVVPCRKCKKADTAVRCDACVASAGFKEVECEQCCAYKRGPRCGFCGYELPEAIKIISGCLRACNFCSRTVFTCYQCRYAITKNVVCLGCRVPL